MAMNLQNYQSGIIWRGSIAKSPSERNEEEHPILYGIAKKIANIGKGSDTLMGVSKIISNSAPVAGEIVDTAIDQTKNAAKGAFNITTWLLSNWQIAIVGTIAIILLLKRL